MRALDGASYELDLVHSPGKREKKHAADLSPYPVKMIALQSLDGADNRFGQLYKPISAEPFASARLKGYYPTNPYRLEATATLNLRTPIEPFHWPTLSELNDDMDQHFWVQDWEYQKWRRDFFEAQWKPVPNLLHGTAPGPPPAAPWVSIPVIPSLEALNAVLVLSDDKLFFISFSIGPNVREWRLAQLDFDASV